MTSRVDIPTTHFAWALSRSGRSEAELSRRFPRLGAWLAGEAHPTLRQLQDFADATWTPLGYFFLAEPPEDALPIADFRRMAGADAARPSVHLLDTIALCQQRQAWYEEYAALYGEPARDFVGSASLADQPAAVARAMADLLDHTMEARQRVTDWEAAFRLLASRAEDAGVLVMASGIVGQNTRRPLDVEEFRGFALASTHAPLVFINSADAPAAQMFTLAHELAHLWLGESGVSSGGVPHAADLAVERWCNRVAAELLVPTDALAAELAAERLDATTALSIARMLARAFRVSTVVMLLRFLECGHLERSCVQELVRAEVNAARLRRSAGSGGHYYRSQARRTGRRLVQAMAVSTWEGNAPFTDAFRLLGVKGTKGFREICEVAGVSP